MGPIFFLMCTLSIQADSTRLITSDIPNFWRGDSLAAGKDSAEQVRIFQTVYLQPGSPGLRDFMVLRLMNRAAVRTHMIAAGWRSGQLDSLRPDSLARLREPFAEHSAADELVHALHLYPRYYADVQARTLSLATDTAVTKRIRRGLVRLRDLYPEARFPDVYFVIGTLSTGGTTGKSGMLIGTEQYGSGPDTPRDELPEWARIATRANNFASLPGLVIHEAVHTQQAQHDRKDTLLRHALGEGVADFLSELAVGPWHANTPRQIYGRAHEHDVWVDFQKEMGSDSSVTKWMYNGMIPEGENHGAIDIGYWVGYAIARSYYARAKDKRAAVRELLLLPDPERLLAGSGYNP
jgi:hypothetical protein